MEVKDILQTIGTWSARLIALREAGIAISFDTSSYVGLSSYYSISFSFTIYGENKSSYKIEWDNEKSPSQEEYDAINGGLDELTDSSLTTLEKEIERKSSAFEQLKFFKIH